MADESAAIKKINEEYRREMAKLTREQSELSGLISQLKSPTAKLIHSISTANDRYKLKITRQDKLIKQLEVEQKNSEVKSEKLKKLNLRLEHFASVTSTTTRYFQDLSKEINALVKIVRDTQQQFGITAGDAAKLRFDNLVQSVDSFITTLRTAGETVPVTAEQIRRAQEDFQAQFGGIIDENSARELAEQAVRMGLTTQQLAEARRVFATQTMGDISAAIQQQDRFIAQFEARGLTAKDAMQFIGSNSELLARSGVRFQQSMAKAAAEAKRIGVDLSKVNQVGDNIIGNFEGFLDSMAELGAMGFGFDTFRLAQVAETGDTGALFDELRSQLAMTGKDLTNLRRSEQLALSSAFGMNIEEFQRLAGILEEPVEEKLQKEANGFLQEIAEKISEFLGKFGEQGANLAQAVGGAITPFFQGINWAVQTALLTAIAFNTSGLGNKLGTLFKRGGASGGLTPAQIRAGFGGSAAKEALARGDLSAATRLARGVDTSTGPGLLGRVGGRLTSGARIGARVGGPVAGIVGGVMGFAQGRELGMDREASVGAGVTRGGAAVGGAIAGGAIGQALLPFLPGVGAVIGAGIGGFVGDKLGTVLNEKLPGLAANIGAFFGGVFEPIKRTFDMFKGTLNPLIDSFKTLFSIFSPTGEAGVMGERAKQLIPIMKTVGTIIGEVLVYGLRTLLIPLRLLIGGITLGINVVTLLAAGIQGLFTGDFSKFKEILGEIGSIILNLGKDLLKLIFEPFINIAKSLGSLITTALQNSPLIGRFFRDSGEADDMVSRPGYGQRTLVTPTATVALNNDDNIIAYADDMIARNTGIELLSKGAIMGEANNTSPVVNVDMSKLERKLDQVIGALSSMEVNMDGIRVGRVLSASEGRALTDAVHRAQRI